MASASSTITDEAKVLNVSPEVEEKFHELVEMIRESGSMDHDERQYWVDVLPIMSEDQIKNLRGILTNEKKQLAEAANSYSQDMEKAVKNVGQEFDEAAYKEKKRARLEAEKQHEEEEAGHEAAALAELENL